MAGEKKFELGDYVEVKDRIAIFYELYPQGRLVTGKVRTELGPDGTPRVIVKAKAYRTPDDPHPGRGTSWMALPGSTPYTRGSEVENAETSAWGRAIGSLGILIDKSIATAQEVQNKQGESEPTPAVVPNADGSLIGIVEAGKSPVDMELRQTPDGPTYGFKLKAGNKAYQVLADGPLADALSLAGLLKAGTRATVWGQVELVPWEKAGKPMPPFARINLERIATADFILPMAEAEPEFPPLTDEEKAAIGGSLPA